MIDMHSEWAHSCSNNATYLGPWAVSPVALPFCFLSFLWSGDGCQEHHHANQGAGLPYILGRTRRLLDERIRSPSPTTRAGWTEEIQKIVQRAVQIRGRGAQEEEEAYAIHLFCIELKWLDVNTWITYLFNHSVFQKDVLFVYVFCW